MEYKCLECDWSGHWDEMIHETLCPKCRHSTEPFDDADDSAQQAAQAS